MEALDHLLAGPLASVPAAIRTAYNNRTQHCYNRHLYSEDRFAQCMKRTVQEVEQMESELRHKLMFVGLKFDECIQKRDRNVCESEGRHHGAAAINQFMQGIGRY